MDDSIYQLTVQVKAACDAGEYLSAKEQLLSALENCKEKLSTRQQIRDLLVGTLLKLRDTECALNHAKSMIREDRSDARGYLRCAQLERILKQDKKALKWYQHGLKNVAATDQLYPHLESHLKKLQATLTYALTTSKPVDPLATLPLEILEQVLSYLQYSAIISMLRVCKTWKTLLSRLSPLNNTVDLRSTKIPIKYEALKPMLQRLSKPVVLLAIQKLTSGAAKVMKDRLAHQRYFSELRHLEISTNGISDAKAMEFAFPQLRTIIFEDSIGMGEILRILQNCPLLTTARFTSWGHCGHDEMPEFPTTMKVLRSTGRELQLLEIRGMAEGAALRTLPSAIMCVFPNIRKLILRNVTLCWHDCMPILDLSHLNLSHLDLANSASDTPFTLPSCIQHCDVSAFVANHHDPYSLFNKNSPATVSLRFLNIFNQVMAPVKDQLLKAVESNPVPTLRHLALSLEHQDPHVDTFKSCVRKGAFSGLYSLSLDDRHQVIKDEDGTLFACCLLNLKELNIGYGSFTGVFLLDFIRRKKDPIEKIRLSSCPNLAAETVAWIRAQNIQLILVNCAWT